MRTALENLFFTDTVSIKKPSPYSYKLIISGQCCTVTVLETSELVNQYKLDLDKAFV